MAHHDIIAIGASAGGFQAVRRIVAGLEADLDAGVLVVMPVNKARSGGLPDILARRGDLPTKFAERDEDVRRGQVYLARRIVTCC